MTKDERDELRKLAELSRQANKHGSENFDMFLYQCSAAIPALLDYIEKLEAMMPHVPETCAHYHEASYSCSVSPGHCLIGVTHRCANGKWQLKEAK